MHKATAAPHWCQRAPKSRLETRSSRESCPRASSRMTIKRSLRDPVVFDGRNLYDPDIMSTVGLTYFAIGRSNVAAGETQVHGKRSTDKVKSDT